MQHVNSQVQTQGDYAKRVQNRHLEIGREAYTELQSISTRNVRVDWAEVGTSTPQSSDTKRDGQKDARSVNRENRSTCTACG